MSNHLIDCAAQVQDLPPVAKLLLLCLANDSRDGSGRIASPGLPEAMLWTARGRSVTLAAFDTLVDRGVIQQHQRGQRGRTAEWLLFPTGCCDVHSRLDRQDLLPAPSSVPAPAGTGRVASGSGISDPDVSKTGSGISDPVTQTGSGNTGDRVRTVRTPPQVLLPRTTTPPPPAASRSARSAQREAEDELAAELRTLRREHDLPSGRWTRIAVVRARAKAVAAGYDPALVDDALRAVAIDPETELPGRVAAPGPWWDAPEADQLRRRRSQREAARAACTACDHGWIDGPDGRPQHCPTCHPSTRSHTA